MKLNVGSGSGSNSTRLWDWVSTEVSQAVIKELPSMIDQITERLIVRFMEQIVASRAIKEKKETTPSRNQETQPEKIKWTHEPALLIRAKEFGANKTSVNCPNEHPIYANYGGTYKFTYQRFKCFKYGYKKNVRRDCINEDVCFYYFQPGHKKSNYPRVAGEAIQTSTHAVPQEEEEVLQSLEKELTTNERFVFSYQRRMSDTGRKY